MLLLEAARLGLQFVDGEAGGVVDPDGCLGELAGDLHQLRKIGLREEPAAQFLHVDLGAGAEETLHERLGGHFEAEDGAGHGIVLPDRDVLDDVHDEGGLPHRGTGRDDDHFPAVEAVRHRVEVGESGHEPAAAAVAVEHVLDRVDHLEDVHAHLLDALLLLGLVPDLEDALLDGVEEVRRALGAVVGLGDAGGAVLDDAPETNFSLRKPT